MTARRLRRFSVEFRTPVNACGICDSTDAPWSMLDYTESMGWTPICGGCADSLKRMAMENFAAQFAERAAGLTPKQRALAGL